jgi:hypothetical protein
VESPALSIRQKHNSDNITMSDLAVVALNAINPLCSVDSCLNQVAGSLGNPIDQYAACTSMFGAPVVATV